MIGQKKPQLSQPKKIVNKLPSEKVVITKITKDMTEEELDRQIDAALDEIFGKEEDEADRTTL